MQYVVKWDWLTLIIYLIIAFVTSLLLKKSIHYKKNKDFFQLFGRKINKKFICYLIIYAVLVFFINTRLITDNVGGADSVRYINYFKTLGYIKFDFIGILKFSGWEYLYFNLMYLIRILGGSYYVFSYIIYSLIVISYLWYFDKNLNDEKRWYVSLLFILPFVKGMNIVRNVFAAAIGLFAIQKIKEGKFIKAILIIILCYLSHYISIILLFFLLFCKFVPEKWYDSRKKILIIGFSSLGITLALIPIIINILKSSRYYNYINRMQFSIWGYIPYIIIFVLIMIFFKDFYKELKRNNHLIYYKMIVFLSIVVPPFTVVNGTYRIMMFFELPRFIMYGDLINVVEKEILLYRKKRNLLVKYNDKSIKKVIHFLLIFVYIAWIVFRIWRMYSDARIMPYINRFFH